MISINIQCHSSNISLFQDYSLFPYILFTIGPTGVNANPSLVHILSNTDNIPLVWYVFNPNQITDYRVVYNGKTIANVTSSTNGYSIVYRDKTKCQRSTSSEITEVCSMLLMDPSPSSVGEYTLIADEYTGIVTVGKQQLNTAIMHQ